MVADLIALASKPASKEIGNDYTRDMGLQRPNENRTRELAPSMVLAVWAAVLSAQGHVLVDALVFDYRKRAVGRLSTLQPRHCIAALPPQGGAEMTARSSAEAVCHPSGTQRALPKHNANAGRMKRLSNLAPAHARKTDTSSTGRSEAFRAAL